MRNISVRSHDRYGVYYFDSETLSTETLIFEEKRNEEEILAEKCAGWGAKITTVSGKGYAFAFYSMNNKVFLQIDKQKWNLSDGNIKLRLNRFFLFNVFKVYNNSAEEFKCACWSKAAKFSHIIDPGFDSMDEENADFLIYLANNGNDKNWLESITFWGSSGIG